MHIEVSLNRIEERRFLVDTIIREMCKTRDFTDDLRNNIDVLRELPDAELVEYVRGVLKPSDRALDPEAYNMPPDAVNRVVVRTHD